MKNVVITGFLVLIISLSQAYAALDLNKLSTICIQVTELQQDNPLDHILLAKSGCCAWHQGVCGCSGDRQLCCDGTVSPTCMCGERSGKGFISTIIEK